MGRHQGGVDRAAAVCSRRDVRKEMKKHLSLQHSGHMHRTFDTLGAYGPAPEHMLYEQVCHSYLEGTGQDCSSTARFFFFSVLTFSLLSFLWTSGRQESAHLYYRTPPIDT